MKNSKFILFLTIVFINLMLLTGVVFSQDEWTVEFDEPTPVGPQVAQGEHNGDIDPDATWVAPANGVLQTVFEDHDPKCDQEAGYVKVQEDAYPVPTAYFRPGGDCVDPVDELFASRLFQVIEGYVVWGEMGGSSGTFVFNFATNTPSPTATNTTEPPDTATPTATATSTPTVTVAATATHTPSPTATEKVDEPQPEEPPACLSVRPERMEDGSYLLWVEAENPQGYTFFDGNGSLYYTSQPLEVGKLQTGVVYSVKVSENDEGCSFQLEPTSLDPIEQPTQLPFQLTLPFLGR